MQLPSFPLDAWYAAAWSMDVKRELFSRTICGKRLVLYRRKDQKVVVLDDACWHRLVPLSLGRLDGDNVVCGYHGLVFEPGGRCVHMPSQETINPTACVRAYPVIERHGLIWVWPGDASKANEQLIPHLPWLQNPEWVGGVSTIHLQCNFRMILDNLMDLTHETFVHAGSIGNAAVAEAPFTCSHTERTVNITRWMLDIDAPPFLRKQLGKSGNVDRWQVIDYVAPSTIHIDVGVAMAGTGAKSGDRSQGINNFVVNVITPETETSSFYLWSFPRNYRIADAQLTDEQRSSIATVFKQDELVLEAQQRALLENLDKEYYNLNIDVGGMWCRRILADMVAAEHPSSNDHIARAAE